MDMWVQGFQTALSGDNPMFLLLGTLIGLVVGVLPAIGPSFGVTLALPFTYAMGPATALILLTSIQAACAFGDSIASILINVPGGPGTVASMWEGYPLTRQGRGGTALGIAAGGSLIGGILGWFSFVLLAGPMTAFALMIGAPEYFVLGVMALALISIASKGETIKGLIMGCLGLLLGMVGPDPISALTFRFSFGLPQLEAGIEITLGALAIFALPQLISMLAEGGSIAGMSPIKDSVLSGVVQVLKRPLTVVRAGIIGWLIGVLPALGTSAAGITAYLVEKKFSKESAQFGNGSMDGLAAAETGKGACILGDGITSLMLGVPGSVTWAILMAALMIHGVQPGPRFMTSGVLPYTVFAGLLLGQIAYFVIGVFTVRYIAKVAYVPNQLLAPIIAILCFMGAFVAKNYTYDIWIMVGLGIFAFFATRNGYPTVPMILGFILADLIESNFHRSLAIGYDSPLIFLERPISLVLVIITVTFIAWPWILDFIRSRRAKEGKDTATLDTITESAEVGEVTYGEIVFGVCFTVILVIMMITASAYRPQIRLFPMLISGIGLALLVYYFLFVLRGKKRLPFAFTGMARDKGGLPWFLGVGAVALYALMVPVLGFIASSALYFLGVVALTGYGSSVRRWVVTVATTIGVLLFLNVFTQMLNVSLPTGIFGF